MNIDIPLAGWLLSFLTFLVGLLPTIYERLSHQGYAIKPVWELKTISQDIDDKNKVRLGIVLKVANAKDKALLIESVTTEKPRIKIKSTLIVHSETIIRTLDLPKDNTKSTKIIYSVLTSGQQDYLPTIIRPQEET